MVPLLRRFRPSAWACVAATALGLLLAVSSPGAARAGSVPYGAVEEFGSDWAGSYSSWGDLNVYSNGDGNEDRQGPFGLQYECVEFAQRWAAVRFGEQAVWGGNAWQLWAAGPNLRVPLTQHPNGSEAPQFGDIMVFNRSASSQFGHVAVVAGVGNGYVLLAEQNWASSGLNRVPMDSPTHVPDRAGLPVIGWLRGPTSSTPPPPPVSVSGNTVPSSRRLALVATDTRMWVSTGWQGNLQSLGNSLAGSPALAAEPPPSSLDQGTVHYLAVSADSHQLYTRTDTSWWTLASVNARCLDSPALLIGRTNGGLTATVACEGTDHGVWLTQASFAPGAALPLDGRWVTLGGATQSGPALAMIGGSPAVIVTGTDHRLYQRTASTAWMPIVPGLTCNAHPSTATSGRLVWLACQGATGSALWYATGVDGAWAAPVSAGGVVVDGPAVSATPAGAVVDVAGSDGQVWEASLSTAGSPSTWAPQGWQTALGPSAIALPLLPIAVASAGTQSTLLATTPGSAPVDLGGTLAGAPAVVGVPSADPASPQSPLDIAVFADTSVQVRNAMSGWQPLTAGSGASCLSAPGALVSGAPGSLVLTVGCEGTDRALWVASTPLPAAGLPTVSGWTSYGGILESGPAIGLVNGTPTFAVTGAGGQLYWRTAKAWWSAVSGWQCNGRPALAGAGATSYLACQGTDQALWWAPDVSGSLSPPQSAGGILVDGPGLAAWSDQAIAFVEGVDGSILQVRIAAGQGSSNWLALPGSSAVSGVAATAL